MKRTQQLISSLSRRRMAACAALVLMLSTAHADLGDEVTTVEIRNSTGFVIEYLFVSPSDSAFWGVDVLDANSALPSGAAVPFYVHYPHTCGAFDVLAIDADGDTYQRQDVEVCDRSGSKPISITANHFDPLGDNDGFTRIQLEIGNDTAENIELLFVSPADSAALGVDVLGTDRVLGRGEGLTLVLPGERGGVFEVVGSGDAGSLYHFRFEVDVDAMQGQIETVVIDESDRR